MPKFSYILALLKMAEKPRGRHFCPQPFNIWPCVKMLLMEVYQKECCISGVFRLTLNLERMLYLNIMFLNDACETDSSQWRNSLVHVH